jgi:molecular chaperone IbpA
VGSTIDIALGGYTVNTYNFPKIFRYSVGFNRMHSLLDSTNYINEVTYPSYNIETDGADAYRITVAVPGYREQELEINLEKDELIIVGKKEHVEDKVSYIHRGMDGLSFNLKFNLADHVKIIHAYLENGILAVDLEREVPEELKPRKIQIETHPIKEFAIKSKKIINGEKKAA